MVKEIKSANFTVMSRYYIYASVKFVSFISLSFRGYKMNKNSKLLTKINSTESYIRDMVLKFLPELIFILEEKLSSIIFTRNINYAFKYTWASILIQGSR